MKIEFNLVKCKDVAPEMDGKYCIVDFSHGYTDLVGDVNYTVEHGWNTTIGYDGTVNNKHRIRFEDSDAAYWATSYTITEADDEQEHA